MLQDGEKPVPFQSAKQNISASDGTSPRLRSEPSGGFPPTMTDLALQDAITQLVEDVATLQSKRRSRSSDCSRGGDGSGEDGDLACDSYLPVLYPSPANEEATLGSAVLENGSAPLRSAPDSGEGSTQPQWSLCRLCECRVATTELEAHLTVCAAHIRANHNLATLNKEAAAVVRTIQRATRQRLLAAIAKVVMEQMKICEPLAHLSHLGQSLDVGMSAATKQDNGHGAQSKLQRQLDSLTQLMGTLMARTSTHKSVEGLYSSSATKLVALARAKLDQVLITHHARPPAQS